MISSVFDVLWLTLSLNAILFTFFFLFLSCLLFFNLKSVIDAHADEEIDACDNKDYATCPVCVFIVSIYVIETT